MACFILILNVLTFAPWAVGGHLVLAEHRTVALVALRRDLLDELLACDGAFDAISTHLLGSVASDVITRLPGKLTVEALRQVA